MLKATMWVHAGIMGQSLITAAQTMTPTIRLFRIQGGPIKGELSVPRPRRVRRSSRLPGRWIITINRSPEALNNTANEEGPSTGCRVNRRDSCLHRPTTLPRDQRHEQGLHYHHNTNNLSQKLIRDALDAARKQTNATARILKLSIRILALEHQLCNVGKGLVASQHKLLEIDKEIAALMAQRPKLPLVESHPSARNPKEDPVLVKIDFLKNKRYWIDRKVRRDTVRVSLKSQPL